MNNYVGIVGLSSNCKISDNTIMNNAVAGVFLTGSSNTIESNLIARNDLGVEITSGWMWQCILREAPKSGVMGKLLHIMADKTALPALIVYPV
jgi:parallel beta-helix repeat protein